MVAQARLPPCRFQNGHDAEMTSRPLRTILIASSVLALACGCTSGRASTPGTLTLPPAGNSTASLEATARAWAHAFLTGSPGDIKALEGPECANNTGTTIPSSTVEAYLHAERIAMKKHFGRALDEINVNRVVTRNMTDNRGEALVRYDLPADVVGNDNWVSYAIHDGRWKVADCRAPIGGSSSSASGTITTGH
jgi:hypothetical protein